MPNPAPMTEGHGHGQNNGIQRTLGRLEEAVDNISKALERSDEKSAEERRHMNETLDEISDKVDPLITRLDALELTVKAHEVTLASYAEREIEIRGAARLGYFLIHIFWMVGACIAFIFGDRLKEPFQKFFTYIFK